MLKVDPVALKALRTNAALSQSAVARRAGLAPSVVSHLERGPRSAYLSTVKKLAAVFGVPLALLVIEDDQRPVAVLTRFRKVAGLSQAELARRAGLSQPTIGELEAGRQAGDQCTWAKLSAALGVPVFVLRNGSAGGVDPVALRALRNLAGLSQTELARHAGVAQPTISDLEAGAKRARLSTVVKLASAFSVHDLLTRNAEPGSVDPVALKALRNLAGLSQAELADGTGVAPSTISDLEAGAKRARLSTVVKLASAFSVHALLITHEDTPQLGSQDTPLRRDQLTGVSPAPGLYR